MSLSVGDIFEDYVESLTNLPSEIDQNMHELRSMDEDFQRHRETYAKHKRSYLKMLRSSTLSSPTTPSPTTPTSTVHMTTSRMQLEKDYKTAIQKQDQKIELAMRMYDLVSRHIERIDSQMVQNNITPTNDWMYQQKNNNNSIHHHSNNSSSIHLSSSNHTLSHSSSNTSITSNSRKSSQWDNWHSDAQKVGNTKKRTLLHGTTGPRKRTHHSNRPNPVMNNGTLVENDIDPNEPRYCYCNQVSFGDMVACDGNNCEKEWFHYSCVGLTEPPAGQWFCNNCTTEKKVKKY